MICQMFGQFLITPPFSSLWNVWLLHSPRINRYYICLPVSFPPLPFNRNRLTKAVSDIVVAAVAFSFSPLALLHPSAVLLRLNINSLYGYQQLRHHTIGGALKQLKSYGQKGRSQCANYGTWIFQSIHVANGAPKGSVLGPRCSNWIYFDCNAFDTSEQGIPKIALFFPYDASLGQLAKLNISICCLIRFQ